jgi:hypothetical protein
MLKSSLIACAALLVAGAASAQQANPPPDNSPRPGAQGGHNHSDAAPTRRPTIASPIKDLLNNAETAPIMERHLPGVANHPMRPQFEDMTLAQVMPLSGGAITQATIDAIAADIAALPAR